MENPITPTSELAQQWYDSIPSTSRSWKQELATQAARWGADQELEACCDTLQRHAHWDLAVCELMADRRPKLPSLAEQALALLDDASTRLDAVHENTIRRALERLQELEKGND